jgi:hypothetical protein
MIGRVSFVLLYLLMSVGSTHTRDLTVITPPLNIETIHEFRRAGLHLAKVLHHRDSCDGFIAERGCKIVVDNSSRPAFPVDLVDS